MWISNVKKEYNLKCKERIQFIGNKGSIETVSGYPYGGATDRRYFLWKFNKIFRYCRNLKRIDSDLYIQLYWNYWQKVLKLQFHLHLNFYFMSILPEINPSVMSNRTRLHHCLLSILTYCCCKNIIITMVAIIWW